MADQEFEYGIGCDRYPEPHRKGMTSEEAVEWLNEWIEEVGRSEPFFLIRRPVGAWEAP